MSTAPSAAIAFSTAGLIAARSARSSATTAMRSPGCRSPSSFATALQRSRSRPNRPRFTPSAASAVAICRPMPRLAPVTNAARPFKPRSMYWAPSPWRRAVMISAGGRPADHYFVSSDRQAELTRRRARPLHCHLREQDEGTGMTARGAWRRLLAVSVVTSLGIAPALAWEPQKPIEIVVPTTPGGGIDRSARTLQRILQEGLVKVPVTVVNKPGAGGAVATTYLNQHAGNGHYVSINSPNLIANDINGRGPRYTEVTPLANLFSEYTVVAVRADSPLRSGRDFVEALRKDPGALAVSTPTTLG